MSGEAAPGGLAPTADPDAGDVIGGGRRAWVLRGVLILAGAAVYANALGAAFVFDDLPQIVDRAAHFSGPVVELFGGERRPVVTATLAFNHALGGLDPRGYHLFNVAVHLAAALVLFDLVRRSAVRLGSCGGLAIGFGAALLWVAHPLTTESVTYVIQRAEAMAALCMLTVLYAILRAADSPRGAAWCGLAIGAAVVGMGSKGTMVAAPPLAYLFDGLVVTGSLRAAWRARWGLHLAIASTWLLLLPTGLAAAVFDATPPARAGVGLGVASVTPLEYLATQPGVILHYLRLALWPSELCIDPRWSVARTVPAIALPAAGLAVGLVLALAAAWRRHPLAYPALAAFVWLAPTSSFVPIRDLAAEHRMYLPLAAVLVIVVAAARAGLRRLSARPSAWVEAALLAVATAGLGARTVVRNCDYASPLALWSATVATAPENARARMNLGVALREAGRPEEALGQLAKAVALEPADALARLDYGAALFEVDRIEEAVPHLRLAAAGLPSRRAAFLALGDALRALGRPGEAVAVYRRADELDPAVTIALAIGNALSEDQRPHEAAAVFEEAARRAEAAGDRGLLASALYNLGNAHFRVDEMDLAIAAYRGALEAAPDHAEARRWLEEARKRREPR